jgi:spermidine/putrescine transport system permease protein
MQVNAVGTLMFVISVVIVVGAEVNSRRRMRALT